MDATKLAAIQMSGTLIVQPVPGCLECNVLVQSLIIHALSGVVATICLALAIATAVTLVVIATATGTSVILLVVALLAV
jgi:hypothetical protein